MIEKFEPQDLGEEPDYFSAKLIYVSRLLSLYKKIKRIELKLPLALERHFLLASMYHTSGLLAEPHDINL